MNCGRDSLVGLRATDRPGYRGEAGVFRRVCKRWACSRCGPRKVKREIARCRRGMQVGFVRFATFTSPGGEDAATSYAQFPKRWHRLMARIQRRFGPIEYYAVVERQKRGAAHIHMVYRGPYIPQAWLSRAARECGFGRVVDIRKAPPNIANYLAKYLAKELADPKVAPPRYFRRVRVSQHWSDWKAPVRERPYEEWWMVNARPEHAALSAQRRGYLVVEVPKEPEEWFQPDRVPRWLRPSELRGGRMRPDMHPAALALASSNPEGRDALQRYFRRRHRGDRWARGTEPVSSAVRRRLAGKTAPLWKP